MRYGGINYYYLYYIIYYYVKFIMRIHKHSYSAQQFLDHTNVLSTMGTEAIILSTVGSGEVTVLTTAPFVQLMH